MASLKEKLELWVKITGVVTDVLEKRLGICQKNVYPVNGIRKTARNLIY